MKLIGLTGGIGSGKSLVAGLYHTLGIPVYESDERAKVLMNQDPGLKNQILQLFGPEAYSEHELNRTWIATKVFTDSSLLKQLNQIVHPAVFKDLKQWAIEPAQADAPYLIQESALLHEENLTGRMKAVILVVAPEELRIARVMQRDQVTREQVLHRIQNQWPDEKKIPLSDYIIYNDGERSLVEQVMEVDRMIRGMS